MAEIDDGDELSPDEVVAGTLSDPDIQGLVTTAEAERLEVASTAQTLSPEALDESLDRGVDRRERHSLIDLRVRYSYALGGFLTAQLMFMNVVLILDGAHAIVLSDTTIRFYLTGTLGEIFGLVSVATNFLFSKQPFLGGRFSRKTRKRAA